jgi:hypothetical protein
MDSLASRAKSSHGLDKSAKGFSGQAVQRKIELEADAGYRIMVMMETTRNGRERNRTKRS